MRLHGQQTIDQPRFQVRQPSRLFTCELKNGVHCYPKMKYAEVPTKTERKDSKNKQNVLLNGCYLLVEE